MIYLTRNYTTKEFETRDDALKFIQIDLEQNDLLYNMIFFKQETDFEIYVYQYNTLYFETYILHTDFDLRERNYIYE